MSAKDESEVDEHSLFLVLRIGYCYI